METLLVNTTGEVSSSSSSDSLPPLVLSTLLFLLFVIPLLVARPILTLLLLSLPPCDLTFL